MRAGRRAGGLVLAGLTAVALAGACSSAEKNAAADVTISSCSADPNGGRPTVAGEIRNHSSKDSGYVFRVTFTDSSGNKVSDGAVSVAKVDAGGTATWHAAGAASAKGPLTCKATNVVRTAVP